MLLLTVPTTVSRLGMRFASAFWLRWELALWRLWRNSAKRLEMFGKSGNRPKNQERATDSVTVYSSSLIGLAVDGLVVENDT